MSQTYFILNLLYFFHWECLRRVWYNNKLSYPSFETGAGEQSSHCFNREVYWSIVAAIAYVHIGFQKGLKQNIKSKQGNVISYEIAYYAYGNEYAQL